MENEKPVKRGSARYALIYWVKSKDSDVINLNQIPLKKDQVKGRTVMLKWKPKGSRKYELCAAKVLQISNDKKELQKRVVNTDGNACKAGQKALPRSALLEKKQLAAQKAMEKLRSERAEIISQQEIANKPRLWNSTSTQQPGCSSADVEVLNIPHSAIMQQGEQADESDVLDSEPEEAVSEDEEEDELSPYMRAVMPEHTYENIVFFEHMMNKTLQTMKSTWEQQHKMTFPVHTVDISEYKTKGADKEPFHTGSSNKCFLLTRLKQEFEAKAVSYDPETGGEIKDWRMLVRQVLVQLYGKRLGNYCAKGRTGSRKGIDPAIYADLFFYAKAFSNMPGDVDDTQYNRFVNVLTANKRSAAKSTPKRPKKLTKMQGGAANHVEPNVAPQQKGNNDIQGLPNQPQGTTTHLQPPLNYVLPHQLQEGSGAIQGPQNQQHGTFQHLQPSPNYVPPQQLQGHQQFQQQYYQADQQHQQPHYQQHLNHLSLYREAPSTAGSGEQDAPLPLTVVIVQSRSQARGK